MARYNWWGDASGPSGAGKGTGATVSSHVLFQPWLEKNECVTGSNLYLPVVMKK